MASFNWPPISGSGSSFITSVTDTNSIDLTVSGAALSADLKLSSAAAGAGNINALCSIVSDGLHVQVPILIGDTGTGGTAGVVPAPASGDATKFLRGDATWASAGGSLPNFTATQILFGDGTNTPITDAGLTFDSGTGTVTALIFAGTAASAVNGSTVATATNASFFPLFAASSTNSNQPFNLDAGLTYNPSTNTLTTDVFVGALTGTASGNTTYTPNNHGVVVSGSGNAMTVIAPDASATKVLKSGGASADPSWLAYDNANTASTLVFRDPSGNFSAGTITASLTGTASGNTTYSANNHGVVVSGSGNAMSVVAPDASTAKFLLSGGTGADPSWDTPGATTGGTGQTTWTAGDLLYASASNTLAKRAIGSTGNILTVSSGLPAWAAPVQASLSVVTKTTTYTAGATDDVIFVSAASSWTLSLPTAVGIQGKMYWIIRTDNDITTAVTIDPNGSETIYGATTVGLYTQNEVWQIISDNANWQVIVHRCQTPATSITLTAASGFGTISNQSSWMVRYGDQARIYGYFKSGSVTGSSAFISFPTGITIDTAKVGSSNKMRLGQWACQVTSGTPTATSSSDRESPIFYDGTNTRFGIGFRNVSNAMNEDNVNLFMVDGDSIAYDLMFPVTNWSA